MRHSVRPAGCSGVQSAWEVSEPRWAILMLVRESFRCQTANLRGANMGVSQAQVGHGRVPRSRRPSFTRLFEACDHPLHLVCDTSISSSEYPSNRIITIARSCSDTPERSFTVYPSHPTSVSLSIRTCSTTIPLL